MQILRDIRDIQYAVPIFTAADINKGARVMPGVTADDSSAKNLGTAILADATNANLLGYLQGLYDYSVSGSAAPYTGLTWPQAVISPCFTSVVCRAEVDLTSYMDVASYSAPTVTITSLEDNIDSAYLYAVAGTGIGQIEFVVTSGSGSCTVKTAFTTALDNTTKMVKIPRLFHTVQTMTATMDKFGTVAAAGTTKIFVLATWISRNGLLERLDPTKHAGLTGLNASALNTKFYVDFIEGNSVGIVVT